MLDQLTEIVGDRRVYRDVLGGRLFSRELSFRGNDRFLEDSHLDFRIGSSLPDDDLGDLLEIQKPVGQGELVRVDDIGGLAEHLEILVMGIEQYDMAVGMVGQDGPKNQRGGTGFARSGRSQDREMLAQQIVGRKIGGQVVVRMECADTHIRLVGSRVYPSALVRRRHEDLVVEHGVRGDTTLKTGPGLVALALRYLAQQLHLEDAPGAVPGFHRHIGDPQIAHDTEGGGAWRRDLEDGADTKIAGVAFAQDALDFGAAYRDHPADGLNGIGARGVFLLELVLKILRNLARHVVHPRPGVHVASR